MKTIVLALLLSLVATPALAQPQVRVIEPQVVDPAPRAQVVAHPDAPEDRDRTEGSGGAMAVLFWIFALGTIGGSIFVITRKNLIAAVMGMVGTFFAVAAVYMLLYAHFLAVIQMLVYAGAIMVLFVFVIMILNKPETEPWALQGLPGKALALLAMLYLTFRLGSVLWDIEPPKAALLAPRPVDIDPTQQGVELAEWGSTAAVGSNLFTEYVFPFEAVSILLLVAVVGAIAVARPLKDDEDQHAAEDPVPS